MSYEKRIFGELLLPIRDQVVEVLLVALLKHHGAVKEFGSGEQEFSDEIADKLGLTTLQRTANMQTLVRKENRIKKFPAWNRLLYRAAALAANQGLLSHPTQTERITGKREWMLTEKGIDDALRLLRIPRSEKLSLPISTYEIEKARKKLEHAQRPEKYSPIDTTRRIQKTTTESLIRTRGFRLSIIEAYEYTCSVCGLKIQSPDFMGWEVEAAHIVPHRFFGKDDIWNGIALCHLHHWAFDSGWFTLRQDFTVEISRKVDILPVDQGRIGDFEVLRTLSANTSRIRLPRETRIHPHPSAILWHREHVFHPGK